MLKVIYISDENVDKLNYYSPFPIWGAILPLLKKDSEYSLS